MNERKIDDKTKVSGWAGTHFSYSEVLAPKNTQEIIEIIKKAETEGKKIIARGAGSSYGDEVLNESNVVLNMREMRKVLDWDKEMGILKIEPGIMYSEVLPLTLADNWTIPVIPGTRYVTMGGALSNNIHGKNSFNKGNFGEHVLEFKIVTANREENICSKETNSELFFGVIGGAGLLGIVTEITLQLQKIPSPYLSVKKVTAPNLNELMDNLDNFAKQNEFVIAQVDCFREGSNLGRGTIHAASFTSVYFNYKEKIESIEYISKKIFGIFPKKLIILLGKYLLSDYTMKWISRIKYFFDKHTASSNHLENLFAFTFLLDNLPGWKKVFKHGFFEYEPLLPKGKAKEVILKLLALTHEYKMPSYLSAIKIHKKDDFLISYSMDGYSFAIDIPRKINDTERQNELFEKMNKIVTEASGIIYLAKDAVLKREDFKKMYRNVDKFLELKNKYDPTSIFQSDMYRRIFK